MGAAQKLITTSLWILQVSAIFADPSSVGEASSQKIPGILDDIFKLPEICLPIAPRFNSQ
jgi:hypothetical protein